MNISIPERISLGASDLRISPLGMGTNAWGFRNRGDPGKQPTLEAALATGINFIDTAEVYLFGGSEKTLGLLLPEHRADVVLASKFFPYPWRLTKASLKAALHASLQRLGVAQLDLYILHFPVPPVPLETCRELGVGLVAFRPLGYGLLTGKYKPEDLPAVLHGRLIRRSDLQRVSPLIELLGKLGLSHDKTPAQVALNWIVCKGAVPIPGAKNPTQAAQNAGALGWRLEAGEVEALDREAARLP